MTVPWIEPKQPPPDRWSRELAPRRNEFEKTMPATLPFAHCESQFFTRLVELGLDVSCIVDVGGSNAAWSTSLAPVFPNARFELFEPLAGRREEYDRVLEWALRTHPNFRMHNIALGDENGVASLWNEPSGVGSSLIADGQPREQKIDVPIRRLDDYRAERGIPQPQVVKIDVQGGELMVLRGGQQTIANADVLHLETWLSRGYGKRTPLLPELMDYLRPMGHLIVHLGDFWRRPDQELISVDAFFVHKRLIDRLTASGARLPWPANWSPAE